MVSDFFVNICILTALFFSYLQLRWHSLEKHLPLKAICLIDGVAAGIMGNLMMYYSIQVTDLTIVDLRHVPVLMILLISGVRPAVIGTILIIAGRFLYGFNLSSVAAIIFMIVTLAGIIVINRMRKSHQPRYISGFYMIFYSNLVFSVVLSVIVRDWSLLETLLPVYWVISCLGGVGIIYLIQYLDRSHSLFKSYEQKASIDHLTGLNNVRQFDFHWNQQLEESEKKKKELSLLIIDVDHFKHVNDTYGHPAGDQVLKQLGRLLQEHTRGTDIVSRNGGEEFSVILPDCSNSCACAIAERIRSEVMSHTFWINATSHIPITVSIGASTYPSTTEDRQEIIDLTDQSLYQAKQLGRNRVVSFTAGGFVQADHRTYSI
ncbi:GGDEF domain-containing protein [Halobacillus kuroshimensis]|uniref:GGDEF domain-containing protein n=1 Tax=Halobacillus kuroshimensis TaxID=302481 RepID=UPI00040F54A6|nr:GGDEF domain-containing protein [Halobacillus kuroshimensis]